MNRSVLWLRSVKRDEGEPEDSDISRPFGSDGVTEPGTGGSGRDQRLNCRDCGVRFLFSVAEQNYFARKNLTNIPRRCHNCRVLRRSGRGGETGSLSALVCADCQSLTYVPFKPNGRKPVYCLTCMHKRRGGTLHIC